MVLAYPIASYGGLSLWHEVTLGTVRGGEPDLTARQVALLLTVYLQAPPHTVRGLATELGVTKPVISRALDTLCRMGLVRRMRDEADRRNVLVMRTLAGAHFLSAFDERVLAALARAPGAAHVTRTDDGTKRFGVDT